MDANTYGRYVSWCGIKRNGHQLVSQFSSTVNLNITFDELPPFVPNQNNRVKFVSLGHKVIVVINGVSQSIDSALSTRPLLPKLNFFWIRNNTSSEKSRVILKDLIFTSLKDKLPDPFMPLLKGVCTQSDGSINGNKNKRNLGQASSKEECLEACIRFYHNSTASSRQDISGCQYDPNVSNNNGCFIYEKDANAASDGIGDITNTGFCWPVRKIIENVENGHCVKYDGSNDGYQTRIKLEKSQTITECRGYCLEYYHRPSTKRQHFSGCQYDTKTTNCFAYDDPNYRVVHEEFVPT